MLTGKIIKTKFINYYIILTILLFLLSSKTVFFGYLIPNKYYTLGLLLIMCIGLLLLKKVKILHKNFYKMVILLLLMIASTTWNLSSLDNSYINGALGFLLALITGMLFVTQFSKKKFFVYYSNIMFIISIISLLCFFVLIFIPELIQSLGVTEYRVEWSSSIIYSPFYTWGWWEFWTRNASMWTEPGFFQMFIVFAILMIVSHSKNIKRPNLKLFILVITLLTTQSTIGYLILMIIIFTYKDYFKNTVSNFRNREDSKLMMLIISITIIAIFVSILSSGIIQDKIFTENGSMMLRTNDFFKSIQIINENPLFGIGFGEKMENIVASYGIGNNSNGLFTMTYIWGVPFMLFYMYQYMNSIISFFEADTRLKKAGLVLIILIMFISQVFWWYPFFNIFFFEWKEKEVY